MIISAILLAVQAAPQATPPAPDVEMTLAPLSLAQQASLRCATSLAVVAAKQKNGDADAMKWPALGERGKEFFVRTIAQLMDETGMQRPGVRLHLVRESEFLRQEGKIDEIMPVCLTMLENAGL